MRIAIVNEEKCKPDKCDLQCKKDCPVVKMGKLCIVVSKKDKAASISEELCNGCNICTKKCPFSAIQIINLPKELTTETIHRYGKNGFKLHRLPVPRLGQVLGIVGKNGIGKSTLLRILSKKLTPNLGDFNNTPDWINILSYFRGSELQNYFTRILEGKLKPLIKPQYVDVIPKMFKKNGGTDDGIKTLLDKKDERGELNNVLKYLDLDFLYNENRSIHTLSGGELQRFAIAYVCIQEADVYIFDEPSSYLDVKQRINAALCIKSVLTSSKYVICVEHDLSMLDYLSDFVCVIHGVPGAYGVVTMPYNVRDGINIFLDGFIPTENLRFRQNSLSFKMLTQVEDIKVTKKKYDISYPNMTKTLGNFKLTIESGTFSTSQITVLLAQNGCGKSSFLKLLMKELLPDFKEKGENKEQQEEEKEKEDECFANWGLCDPKGEKKGGEKEEEKEGVPDLNISYKPQIIPSYQGNVKDLFLQKIRSSYVNSQFNSEVLRPLDAESILDLDCGTLSGGELQRVAIILCLGTPADVYLIDEPSAYLDCEQRINVAKVVKRFIMHNKKSAFIVEHDFIMATYLADRVIYYDGIPSQDCIAHTPESLLSGMNKFLKQLEITFRRDPTNYRPRVNKYLSVKDNEQKLSGNYFFLD